MILHFFSAFFSWTIQQGRLILSSAYVGMFCLENMIWNLNRFPRKFFTINIYLNFIHKMADLCHLLQGFFFLIQKIISCLLFLSYCLNKHFPILAHLGWFLHLYSSAHFQTLITYSVPSLVPELGNQRFPAMISASIKLISYYSDNALSPFFITWVIPLSLHFWKLPQILR